MKAAVHTWYMLGRQARNLMREPIWVVLLLVQPMVWLLLYGQLFKHVPRLGGFGTQSYITFLAPGIVVMQAFFGASWSGMGMITDLDRGVIERFLATPASRLAGVARNRSITPRSRSVIMPIPLQLAPKNACITTIPGARKVMYECVPKPPSRGTCLNSCP